MTRGMIFEHSSTVVTSTVTRAVPSDTTRTAALRRRLTRRIPSMCAFAAGFLLVLLCALRGGSYGLIPRQELGLAAWWLLGIGTAIGLLPRKRPKLTALLPLVALAAYAAWTALSLTWSDSSELTFNELARVTSYLGLYALIVATLDRRTWRAAVAGLGFGAVAVCVLAVASRLDPSAFPPDRAAAAFQADRLDYPFGYWNAVGAWGAMSAAFALAFATHAAHRVGRCLALALLPVCCLATYLSYSRAGYAALIVGVIAVLAVSRNRLLTFVSGVVAAAGTALAVGAVRGAPEIAHATGSSGAGSVFGALVFAAGFGATAALVLEWVGGGRWRVSRRVARPAGIIAAAIVLVAAAGLGPHLASRAWHSFKNTDTHPTAVGTTRVTTLSGTRYNLWRVALEAFESQPVNGSGAGTYRFQWAQRQRDAESVINAHSLWLENLSELGIPGLLLVIGAFSALLLAVADVRRTARRTSSAGAAAAGIAVLIVFLLTASVDWMWQSTAITVLALATVAAVSARSSRRPLRLPLWARAGAVVVCLGLTAVQVPGLLSTAEIHRSQAAFRAGAAPVALAWARDAVSAEPWSASAVEQRALVKEASSQIPAASGDEQLAVQREPANYLHWLILARLEVELGRYAAASRDLSRARSLGRLERVFALPVPRASPGSTPHR